MAWIYLAESEECRLHSSGGLDRSLIVKSNPIVKQSCFRGWPNQFYRMHQSGMTYERLEKNGFLTHFPLRSFTGAFHVKTSALQEMEKAWKDSEAGYFSRSCAWPKKSSQNSYSLKMSRQSQVEEDFESLKKLPRWGMIVDGVLYPLRPLERYTLGKGGSYWATPKSRDYNEEGLKSGMKRKNPSLPTVVKMWPTPTAVQVMESYENYQKRMRNSKNPKNVGKTTPQNLQMAVRMWPIPDSNARGAYKNQEERIGHHFTIQNVVGSGKLSPTWVEWLMGFAKEWTELSPWAMHWYLLSVKKRSKS